MPELLRRVVTAAFVLFLLAVGVATLLRDKEAVSFFENCVLTARPTYTAQSEGDGSYARARERYLSDHAAGRTPLLRVKAKADLLLRCSVVNDVVTEGALLPYIPEEIVTHEEIAAQADAMAERGAAIRSAVESHRRQRRRGMKLHARKHTAKYGKGAVHEVFAHPFRFPRRGEKMAHFFFCYALA